ncbi:MAG: hypothetical protein L7R49_03740 [Nitrosopumilus sp.]|jgi:hypothetical protein|nr:hypothetical protein [Nitrosopumilus sp.]
MKKNIVLGLTIISCIGVIFAVISDDKMEEVENPTEIKEGISKNEEISTEEKVVELNAKQRIDELQLQYDEIIEYSCMKSKPQSYFEIVMEERILEAEHRLRYLSEQQSEIQNIKNEIQALNEKELGLNNEPFVLYEWECENQKYWVEEYPHLQEILE